jgi:hypothetical protein
MKPKQRQSFSIESLAVSSRQEAPERDTESPYLTYLASQSSAAMDYNYNRVIPRVPSTNAVHPAFPHHIAEADGHMNYFVCDLRMSNHSTSTPKVPSPIPRRADTTSLPPSASSDDSGADDKMVIDESVVTDSYPDVEKHSPGSTTASSATSGWCCVFFQII